ncbi:hypothetical protein [Glycomyces tenuis]|uniref:hypothetical protein n=1 Tax=Glycomyces tenuis TaxID=58116 RepID=UPI000423D161|nr:hypothetical protein [Glycomyces tenuis]
MIRSEKFLISQRPYAINLDSFTVEERDMNDRMYWVVDVESVWFRRRRGATVAAIGHIQSYNFDHRPADVHSFLTGLDDSRDSGRCEGRWDGTRYWGAQEPNVIEKHLALLRPMLDNYPAIPDGFDGWWRFR